MSKFTEFLKKSYIYIILALTYIPLCFAAIFSFNKPSDKGYLSSKWNTFSAEAWTTFFDGGRDVALINSVIIAIFTAVLVISISLVTVFALWRQKNKNYERVIKSVNNIPLINPDNITAIGLVLVFSFFFGTLSVAKEGLLRGIVGHTVMALPYGISLMYPRSEKFERSLFEASQDLGYSKFKTWFKTYFIYMIPSIIFVGLVAAFLSFDDFIILKTTTNTSTLGTKLYEGNFRGWGLVVGAAVLTLTLIGNAIYIAYKVRKNKLKKIAPKGNNEN
ncbi:ABC transporter permease subunit [Mycoplasma sp. ES3157-GEN-MYC]|uniref:ABC transporter permease subunit n=1 Tax=Mycoplasma miroungigenitalium TaxID=754515 RepID=A0A6M4JBE2_9MOLU|nr:ABC transporter permease subunit [Mycoplasma miroungigenitalium]MBU4690578.1 ABC transporter permease subunit [Mycoplasma miroungigenitalium]MBU4691845.1 ABC transporter permease subunit [Mycoplasma miroungigenitalium]QJR43705.1 ABC transporter permease subunit [Mycoplasma miroungigenitalium]